MPINRAANLERVLATLRAAYIVVAVLCVPSISGCSLLPWEDSPSEGSQAADDEGLDDSGDDSSSASNDEGEAKEIKSEDSAKLTDEPEAELIRAAKRVYQAKAYSAAQDSLISLRDRYPLGAYGQWAAIKAADAYYYNGEMDKAAAAYEEFLKNFPGSVDTPYVKLQAARAHLASAKGVGRDRQPLERSLLLFDEITQDFSDTPYAVVARSERTPALKELAAYDQFIIDFYKRTDNDAAVKEREKMYQERWGPRIEKGEFQETSEEIQLEPVDLAPPATEQAEEREEAAVKAQEAEAAPPEIIERESVTIEEVRCDSSQIPYAIITVSSLPDEYAPGDVIKLLHPHEGLVEVPFLQVRPLSHPHACFSPDDLVVLASGHLALRTSSSAVLTTLFDPPRIVLTTVQR